MIKIANIEIYHDIQLSFGTSDVKRTVIKQNSEDTHILRIKLYDNQNNEMVIDSNWSINISALKGDKTHILNTNNISVANNTIQVTMTKQMLTASGTEKCELVIQDGELVLFSDTFLIYVEPNVQDGSYIESSDEYNSIVDSLNKVKGYEQEALTAKDHVVTVSNEVDVLKKDIENTYDELEDAVSRTNELIAENEVIKQNENDRIEAEKIRVANETARQQAETERNANEQERIVNEETRKSNEEARIQAENVRSNAETSRNDAESLRVSHEEARVISENERIVNEQKRIQAESTREKNEENRKKAETTREAAESTRVAEFNKIKSDAETEITKLQNVNIEAIEGQESYQVKITDKDGNSKTSDNLLNKISIGTVDKGDYNENPSATITGEFGNQKLNLRLPTGNPFVISKTYSSISEMEADKDNINLYDFVMINTGSVEDEDNGKLYMKDSNGMMFITDLSGVQGIQGVKGETGETPIITIGTVTTGAPGTQASATITGTKENPVINFIIPRGDTGKMENVSADSIGYSSPSDTETIKDVVDEKLGKNENAVSATKAINDKNGNDIASTYVNSLAVEGRVITYTKGDGSTDTITTQDTNTTYSAGTGLSLSGTTFNHKNSVIAGTAQGDASKTLTFGGTFTIPTVTYDSQGHITGKGTTTMTMPANPNTWRGIQDNLTSTSTTDSLSANQGKILKGLVDQKAESSHTHTPSSIGAADNITYDEDTGELCLKSGDKVLSTVTVEGGGGGGGISLAEPTNVSLANADESAVIKWTDPSDIEVSGVTLATWSGTLVVRKVGSAPTSKTDGVVVVDSKTRNQYSSTGFTDTGLTNGTKYYYGIFPYTVDNNYTYSYSASITPSAIYPSAPTGVSLTAGNGEIKVSFTKPSNATGIRIVYGTTSPTSETDGTIVNTTTSPYTISNLTNDTLYYVRVYSYNAKGRFTASSAVSATPKSLQLVPWSTGTDAQIKAMVDGYYAGDITLTQIKSVWSVGDTRNVTLSAMSATGVGESHASQTVGLTIIDFNHDDLATSVNGKTKALVTVQLKNCLNEKGYMNSTDTNSGGWEGSARRTWCNNTFKSSIPSTIRTLIRNVNKKNYKVYNSTTLSTTSDSCFLLSETEIFGSKTYSAGATEGTQYEYYKTSSNRVKQVNDSNYWWWERSPYSGNSYGFCGVDSSGYASGGYASGAIGLAPGFCF